MNPFLVYSAADAKLDVVKIQEKSVYLLLYENILSDIVSRKKMEHLVKLCDVIQILNQTNFVPSSFN